MSITLKKNSLFVKDGGEYKDIAVYSAPETVEKWLDDHPEITTSIQDGEVTFSKLNSTVQNRISSTESDVSTLQSGLSSEVSARNAADTNLNNQISALRGAVGSPLVAATAAAMTDTDKIYVYTGDQSGYTNGNWYYYSGAAWVSGGVYNSQALETDKTLAVENMAADAKITGDKINNFEKSLNNIRIFLTPILNVGYISFRGTVQTENKQYRYTDPIHIEAGDKLYVYTEMPANNPTTISVISKYENGINIPLIIGKASEFTTYEYNAVEEMDLVICIKPTTGYYMSIFPNKYVKELKADIAINRAICDLNDEYIVYTNDYTKNDYKDIALDGTMIDATYGTHKVTSLIPCDSVELLAITGSFSKNENHTHIAFYNSNDVFISGINVFIATGSQKVTHYKITVPEDAMYFRVAEVYSKTAETNNLPLSIEYLPSLSSFDLTKLKKTVNSLLSYKEIKYADETGKYLDANGIAQDTQWNTNHVTEYLSCIDLSKIYITGCFATQTARMSIAFYDEDKTFLSGRHFYTETQTTEIIRYEVAIPNGAYYYRISNVYSVSAEGFKIPLTIEILANTIQNVVNVAYVSPDGSDSNSGTLPNDSFLTIQKAIDEGFHTIILAAGEYKDQQINIKNKHDIKIICYSTTYQTEFDDNHQRKARAILDNSINITLESYDNIYRSALTVKNDSSFQKVFIDKTLDIIYTASDYYGRVPTYNAILWEVTGNSPTTKQLVPVLTLEECKTNIGTFTFDGSYIYVNPYNGTIDGKTYKLLNLDAKQIGISIEDSTDICIDGLEACYFPYKNFYFLRNSNIKLYNCKSLCSCYSSGFSFLNTDVNSYNCTSIIAGADGYGISGSGNASFYNCSAYYCHDDGISHHDYSSGEIDGGIWEGCLKGGVTPSYGSRVNVKNVVSRYNQKGIYYLAEATGRHTDAPVVISNCLAYDNNTYDIDIDQYTVTMFGCAYKTEHIGSAATVTKYANTIIE